MSRLRGWAGPEITAAGASPAYSGTRFERFPTAGAALRFRKRENPQDPRSWGLSE